MAEEDVPLVLSSDEALVLFEMLARARLDVDTSITLEDRAERAVMWALQGMLEKRLVAPFQDSYLEQVRQAKERLDPGPE